MNASTDHDAAHLACAQAALKRAYLLLGYGHFEQAIAACEEAIAHCPNHPLAPALQGAILCASGRTSEALQHLARVMRRFPDEIVARIYFCEACFLGGRTQRGFKELDKLDDELSDDDPWTPFVDSLRESFEGLDPKQIPPALVVPQMPIEQTSA
ncbi:MAG: tetratricopeptide repeat protein [Bradymonadaceae bacterium]|nr:tetratricopeptide repeat protein [Lujinxingiaceae bacterium]